MSLEMELKPEVDIFKVNYFKFWLYIFIPLLVLSFVPFLKFWGHDMKREFIEGRTTERFNIVNIVPNSKVDVVYEDGRKEEKSVGVFINNNLVCSKDIDYIEEASAGKGGLIFLTIIHIALVWGLSYVLSEIFDPLYDKSLMKPKHIVKGSIQ